MTALIFAGLGLVLMSEPPMLLPIARSPRLNRLPNDVVDWRSSRNSYINATLSKAYFINKRV